DGSLEFIGRSDEQVKIRGFRIELGEIEQCLSQLPAVNSIVVLAREDEPGQKRLVAYYTSETQQGADTMRAAAKAILPDHMVPSFFVLLEALPLTPNEKVDKKALPAPDALLMAEYVEAVTKTETTMVLIWSDLLKVAVDKLSTTANFFESGGHSLLSVRLVGEVRALLGIELAIRAVFEHPVLSDLAELIEEKVEQKTEQNIGKETRPQVVAIKRDAPSFAPSFAQDRLWFIDQMDGTSVQYNMPSAMRFKGVFDQVIVEQAFTRIIERHEPLRTVFANGVGGVRQLIHSGFDFKLHTIDLVGHDHDQQCESVRRAVEADAEKAFDLTADLMLRSTFIRLSHDQGVLLFNMHHIASDGWSMDIVVKEFCSQYQSIRDGIANPLPPLAIQYADYAQWQRQYLSKEGLKSQLDYWAQQLAGLPQVHSLPLDRPRPKVQGFDGGLVTFSLEQEAFCGLKQLALAHNASLFMVLQGAFSLLLSRHSNSDDIVMGVPVANRLQKELTPIIGFFVNTLVLRTDCSKNPSFSDYLNDIKQVNLDAQAKQDVPFEQLVERLKPARSTAYSPLFQVMFSMANDDIGALELADVTLSPFSEHQKTVAKFELTLNAAQSADELSFSFEYNVDLFDPGTVERLAQHLVRLLRGIVANPQSRIDSLPMLSENEQHQLLHTLNDTQVDQPQYCIHQWFEQQVKLVPGNTALIFEQQRLSYRALNEKANQLAHYLTRQGVKPDTLVGLCVARSMDMVVAILAVFKAGGAYVPLDPHYPQSRLDYMIQDSGIELLLTQRALDIAVDTTALNVISLDDESLQQSLLEFSVENPPTPDNHSTANLAYVIYTSGSTGKPKGVMVEHRNTSALINWATSYYSADELACVLASTSLNFDLSIFELFVPLSSGHSCLIVQNILRLTDNNFINPGLTLINTVPSGIGALVDNNAVPPSIKVINLAGEVLKQSLVQRLNKQQRRVVNLYGPSEDTTYSTVMSMNAEFSGEPNIGKPIDNTVVYILDTHCQLVPKGCIGELHIGGAGLARGYHNRADLTAQRFIQNPFERGQLYKTGDLVRYLPDGNLEYIGRIDDQVKIRGFRIELGEIEHQLSHFASVKSAVVLPREEDNGQKMLVAFVVKATQAVNSLREDLQASLPEHMVPSLFVLLDEMPLLPNGKIDKKALSVWDISAAGVAQSQYIAPTTATEIRLVQIWSALLKIEADIISTTANFFEVGGHSLLSLRLVGEVRVQLGAELAIADVFTSPRLSQLAILIDGLAQKGSGKTIRPPVVALERESNQHQASFAPSFAQERLWFIDQMDGGSSQYNMPVALRINGQFDERAIELAFARIIQRHEPLRTVFIDSDEGAQQVIRRDFSFELSRIDLTGLDSKAQQTAVQQAAQDDAKRVFNLSEDLMLRSTLIRLNASESVLLFNLHHIAADGWSMGLLTSEFAQQFEAIQSGKPNQLAPLTVQYADYAQWQRDWLMGEELQSQLQYWQKQLADLPQVHNLLLDRPRPKIQGFNGAMASFEVESLTLNGLKQLALNHNATLFMVLHGAFSLLLSRHSNSDDIVIGVPVANRLQKELEPIIGFFINTLVLRADCSGNPSFGDYLANIKATNLAAQAHQDVPFEYLVDKLKPARSTAHSALFQIMFSMNTNEEVALELPGLTLSGLADQQEQVLAKFDLTLNAFEGESGLSLAFQYNTDLFDATTIERLGTHLVNLLQGIVAQPQLNIDDLPMLCEQELHYLQTTLNDTQVEYDKQTCVHQLFEQQVKRSPDKRAVIFEQDQLSHFLSYQSLNEKANRLAHYLRARGVVSNTLVGLCVERSLDMVIGILAILKAGGAYVPLDPNYPQDRLDYMVKDSDIKLLLSQTALKGRFKTDSLTIDCLDDESFNSRLEKQLVSNPLPLHSQISADLVYVIYTSGSTGQPKGVMVEHANLLAYNLAFKTQLAQLNNQNSTAPWLWIASMAFDASVKGILSLCHGKPVVIVPALVSQDPALIAPLIKKYKVDVFNASPALMAQVIDYLTAVVKAHGSGPNLIVSGDQVSEFALAKIRAYVKAGFGQAINAYGPTETTVNSTYAMITAGEKDSLTIGRPVHNTQTYVLNQYLKPLPAGVTGELYIGGAGVARGYLNQPELTAERFIANPFGEQGGSRLYKSGDLVRYLPDGRLVFVGRNDGQVKIRGFRIEMGEI
ncbi:MAG: amino acid adenylation domain-containing protein, partial [Algicola sp.]|nr:amino acid adenylation domain-containing protein [Algicola sp.]